MRVEMFTFNTYSFLVGPWYTVVIITLDNIDSIDNMMRKLSEEEIADSAETLVGNLTNLKPPL